MKHSMILIAALFSLQSFAANQTLTCEEQVERIEKLAKDLRRDFWIQGHEDVDSKINHFDRSELDKYLSPDLNYLEYPYGDEIEVSYECIEASECELYQISVSSSYYGGYGVEGHLITLNIKTGQLEVFSHIIYSE